MTFKTTSAKCEEQINVREYRRGNKYGQCRETGNIWQTVRKHNTICVGHHYAQTNTNKTQASSQTMEGKD